ncbi:MAG: hypothetical protein FJW14_19530 [Acidimicrobiia bacterium]|nr:hypothetical protein [Acidimicrobiia bacterium]
MQFSPLLVEMRAVWWLFPGIAILHLLGLAILAGAVLLVDLRLLGFGARRVPVAVLARDAERWLKGGLAVMLSTGLLLFMCFATKYYYLAFFWVKMAALAGVIVFTFTVRRRVALADEAGAGGTRRKTVALMSLSLWTTVALGGRWIGFP